MKGKTALIVYALLFAYTIGPVFVVILAQTIAWLAGSKISETTVHSTFIFGHDIGPLLYSAIIFAYLPIITFPTGGIMLIGFTIAVLISNRNRDAKDRKNA